MVGEGHPVRPWTALSLLCLLITVGSVLTGCGKQGPPLPPLRNIPLRTMDLTLRQEGPFLVLGMTYPSSTTSGMALGGVDAVELFALTKAAASEDLLPEVDPREFEVGATTLLTLRGADLDAAITGDRIQWRLPLAEPLPAEKIAQFFAVRTVKGEEVSDSSNRVGLIAIEPPTPPSKLEARPTAAGIELSWENAEDTAAFDIFRREAQNRGYEEEALARVPGEERAYVDQSAAFGHRYIYTVRTVAQTEPLIYSAEAGEQEVDYEDRFAPPLPSNFVALPEVGSVRLRWDPSPAADVLGYILYRRDPGRDFRRITDEPVRGVEHIDRGLAHGLSYSYRLRVVDQAGNESALSDPISATLR